MRASVHLTNGARAAHALLESGQAIGKITLTGFPD